MKGPVSKTGVPVPGTEGSNPSSSVVPSPRIHGAAGLWVPIPFSESSPSWSGCGTARHLLCPHDSRANQSKAHICCPQPIRLGGHPGVPRDRGVDSQAPGFGRWPSSRGHASRPLNVPTQPMPRVDRMALSTGSLIRPHASRLGRFATSFAYEFPKNQQAPRALGTTRPGSLPPESLALSVRCIRIHSPITSQRWQRESVLRRLPVVRFLRS